MPQPMPFPCGKEHQPACPPQPAAVTDEPVVYTISEMQEHGWNCYQKGRADERMMPHPADDGAK